MKRVMSFCIILISASLLTLPAVAKRVSIKNALNAALEDSHKEARVNKKKANKRPRESDILIRTKSHSPEIVDVDPNEISGDKPKSEVLQWRDERREVIEDAPVALDAADGE